MRWEQTGSAPGRPPDASVDTRVISTPLSLFSLTPYSLAYRWKPSPALNRYLRAAQPSGSAGHRRTVELLRLLAREKGSVILPKPDLTQIHHTEHAVAKVKSAEQHGVAERLIPPGRKFAALCCTAHLSWSKKSSTDGSVSPVSVPSPSTCDQETSGRCSLNCVPCYRHASPALSWLLLVSNQEQ